MIAKENEMDTNKAVFAAALGALLDRKQVEAFQEVFDMDALADAATAFVDTLTDEQLFVELLTEASKLFPAFRKQRGTLQGSGDSR
jgi:hypothetical protein